MTEEEKIRIGSTALVVIGFVSIFIYFLITMANDMTKEKIQTHLKSNEEFFNKQGSLLCRNSPFLIGTNYLVSKESGWEIYKDIYFKKGDILIERNNCARDESDTK